MEITWLGHSCFRLRSSDLVVITDPFPDSIGLSLGAHRALAVTVSNEGENHSHWRGVAGEPKVLNGPGEYELSGIYITGIMTPRAEGDPPGFRNTAYLLEMESLRLCHLGDVRSALSTRQVEELTPVDVLFLPVGGTCTVEVPQSIEIVQSLSPKVVIPMHYSVPALKVPLGGLEPFLKELSLVDVETIPRLNVSKSSMPQERRVVLMEPQGAQVEG